MANIQSASERSHTRPLAEFREHHRADLQRDLIEYLKEYARDNPGAAALWCFGVGFILGWKLKPWKRVSP
ncbi:MAG TPA: hypothetical protein VFW73_13295, partial [Lacipirellulaceae bacterium]|nr:hypothetical protein [Lacipirellulaceae bacterium]